MGKTYRWTASGVGSQAVGRGSGTVKGGDNYTKADAKRDITRYLAERGVQAPDIYIEEIR